MTAVRLNPQLGSACAKIGRFFLLRGLGQPAVSWLSRAIEADSNDMNSIKELAIAESLYGCKEHVASLLEKWIADDPENPVRRHLALGILGEHSPPRPVDGYVERLFDGYAERFDESLRKLEYCGPDLIAEALQQYPRSRVESWTALDIGCGTGLVGEVLRPCLRRIVGVDVSEKMVGKAAERRVYDELFVDEMHAAMRRRPGQFDLITAADVLTYLGDLGEFFAATRDALRPDGVLIAVLEAIEDAGDSIEYRLNATGRYSHSEAYLRRGLRDNGFSILSVVSKPMRIERGSPAPTMTVTAHRSSAPS